MDRYETKRIIGRGSFGTAMLVDERISGLERVVKQIPILDMSENEYEGAINEVRVLSMLKHPNIIRYHESFVDSGALCIVMDYANAGDLDTRIKEANNVYFNEEKILDWFVQIALAMNHIHSRGILHRDLKTSNIFLTASSRHNIDIIKLGDFGIARILTSQTSFAKTTVGTPYYLSPEICEDKPYNQKSDIWSLGCILYEITTLKHAFDGKSLPALVLKILRGKYPPISSNYSRDLVDLIDSMLRQDPTKRPSIVDILRKPFIQKRLNFLATALANVNIDTVQVADLDHDVSKLNNNNLITIPKQPILPINNTNNSNNNNNAFEDFKKREADNFKERRIAHLQKIQQSTVPQQQQEPQSAELLSNSKSSLSSIDSVNTNENIKKSIPLEQNSNLLPKSQSQNSIKSNNNNNNNNIQKTPRVTKPATTTTTSSSLSTKTTVAAKKNTAPGKTVESKSNEGTKMIKKTPTTTVPKISNAKAMIPTVTKEVKLEEKMKKVELQKKQEARKLELAKHQSDYKKIINSAAPRIKRGEKPFSGLYTTTTGTTTTTMNETNETTTMSDDDEDVDVDENIQVAIENNEINEESVIDDAVVDDDDDDIVDDESNDTDAEIEIVKKIQEDVIKISNDNNNNNNNMSEIGNANNNNNNNQNNRLTQVEKETLSARIHQLRKYCEDEIGKEKFNQYYDHLRSISNQENVSANCRPTSSGNNSNFIIAKHIPYFRYINQLIYCEDRLNMDEKV